MYVVYENDRAASEVLEPRNMRGVIGDLEAIIEFNAKARDIMTEKDRGRPGHYYGRDIVIEGSVPVALHHAAAIEYGGDPDWWKDDRLFADFMKRNPMFSWLNGG